MQKQAVIIGGGFYGARIAVHLKRYFKRVVLVEKESSLMTRASYANQARVHGGYHYPRSLLTGMRSRVNMHDFMSEYEPAVEQTFQMYYGVARSLSKVTRNQFNEFCRRIDAPLSEAPKHITDLFDDKLVEGVFEAEEYAFNADILRTMIESQLVEAGVEVLLDTEMVDAVHSKHGFTVQVKSALGTERELLADAVFNCTYSGINQINKAAHAPAIPLKHELAEIALVSVPDELAEFGVTMMCGPFFSSMPFPARSLHSFTHVRYTPHTEYHESADKPVAPSLDHKAGYQSTFVKMQSDAARYMPILKNVEYKDSLFELKTVLPQSEKDDSRPILFIKDHAYAGYHCIMGGKIDNIYDVLNEMDEMYGE